MSERVIPSPPPDVYEGDWTFKPGDNVHLIKAADPFVAAVLPADAEGEVVRVGFQGMVYIRWLVREANPVKEEPAEYVVYGMDDTKGDEVCLRS
jgi:hypothetical protein